MTDGSTKYLRRNEAAEYLRKQYGVGTVATLAKLASIGGGPYYRLNGRFPVYTRECLDEWGAARLSKLVRNTAEASAA